jgi:hypothetical protein
VPKKQPKQPKRKPARTPQNKAVSAPENKERVKICPFCGNPMAECECVKGR